MFWLASAQDLFTVVRSKAHRKRSVGSLRWALGGGLDLTVKLYQLLQPQKAPGVRMVAAAASEQLLGSRWQGCWA
jgi:hypothetical protein